MLNSYKLNNILILTLAIIVTVSCSSTKKQGRFSSLHTKIEKDEDDSFNKESFLRYSKKRLETLSTDQKIVQANISCHKGDIKNGLNQLQKSFKNEKKNFYYWNIIANCYFLKNDYNKAKYFYEIAIKTAKDSNRTLKKKINSSSAYNNLGVLYLSQRHYDLAYQSLNKAIKLSPNSLTPKFNMALFNIQFYKYNDAKNILKKLYDKNPTDIDIISSLGTIAVMENRYSKAKELFESIPPEQRSRQDIANYYAYSLYKLGELEEAEDIISSTDYSQFTILNHNQDMLKDAIEKKLQALEQTEQENVIEKQELEVDETNKVNAKKGNNNLSSKKLVKG